MQSPLFRPALVSAAAMFSLLLLRPSAAAAKEEEAPDLTVHEWGTFLAVQGSDGAVLDGMYHEEHALPDFVHARSKDQLRIPSARLKGETPVIYFYTQRKQKVDVEVRFPAGIWTQWYPQASLVAPGLAQTGSPPQLKNGRIEWSAEIIPPGDGALAAGLPPPEPLSLWNFARQVDAAYVRIHSRALTERNEPALPEKDEYERFIFYRGLGHASLPLEMAPEGGGTLSLKEPQAGPGLRHLFVLRIENGKGSYRYFPELPQGKPLSAAIPPAGGGLPIQAFQRELGAELASRLVSSGLYPKEAEAMVNTWRTSYFTSDGIRVLFVLPQEWTDRFIPLKVSPRPGKVVRVMVGRLEVLTREREEAAESSVRELGSGDRWARERAFNRLRGEGRYVEPILRRVLLSSADEEVKTLCRRLLFTDFVTELRSAIRSPADGVKVSEERVRVRAELASLLDELGMKEEASREGQAALKELEKVKEPPLSSDQARHYLRAKARALEGLGDDRAAAQGYESFIRYGLQVEKGGQCTGCHDGVSAPRGLGWFKDWWAGRRYARHEERSGGLGAAMARQETVLAGDPRNTAARVLLDYLKQAKAEGERLASARRP
jgi:hypothetical protein